MDAPPFSIRVFDPSDEAGVIALWRACGLVRPWNDPVEEIREKVSVQPGLFFVGEMEGRVVGSVMAGYDGHRGWLYLLGVLPEHQGRGLGQQLVNTAVENLRALGCRKVNLQVRTTNLGVMAFYERLGFVSDDVAGMGLRLTREP